ncbi:MAG: redoxin domain-containing protein [Syntrophales bacterium]|jgi:peroxiredoxin
MKEQSVIAIGKKIRDFTLKDQGNNDIHLSDYKGGKILLSFHPLAWTSICAAQMQSLEKNFKLFEKYNTVALGISVDSAPCKMAWAKSLKIKNTRLLCDFWPHGHFAKTLGLFREHNGFSERANVVLDEKDRVLFVRVYPIKELPVMDEILKVIKG